MKPSSSASAVKEQYERYPYPPRKPEEERRTLRSPFFSCLDAINYFGFGGKRNFHKNFRILAAGGGTGDSSIFLAEQLRDTDASIVHMDISQPAIDIAKARAAERKLTNIEWLQASLLDIASLGLGKFDFINCTGVLHHLEQPEAGLKALEGALAAGGVMSLMLYGKYGRTAIYQMQQLQHLLAGHEDDATRIEVCKRTLGALPPTNWFHHSQNWFNDAGRDDASLYDLLLHSVDRSFSVPELYTLVEGAGLHIASGLEPCDPAHFIRDEVLLARIRSLDLKTQYAIGELLIGSVKKHAFYAVREVIAPPSPDDTDMIPSFSVNMSPEMYAHIYGSAKTSRTHVHLTFGAYTVQLPVSHAMISFLKYFDGRRTLKDIYTLAGTTENVGAEDLKQAFAVLYKSFFPGQMIYLRAAGVPYYATTREMQTRLGNPPA